MAFAMADMSEKIDAWMPIWIGDYLADTQSLTCEQHGAYLLLIFRYWRKGPPPDDDDVLMSIAKLDAKAWARARKSLECMFQIGNGVWRHRRIDRELERALEKRNILKNRAKIAAKARWGDSSKHAKSNATSIPKAVLEECPSPSPSHIDKEPIGPLSKNARARFALPDWIPEAEWLGFCEMRRSIKAPLTDRAKAGIVRDLERLADDGHQPGRVLDQSTMNAWRGVFPLKDGTNDRNLGRNSTPFRDGKELAGGELGRMAAAVASVRADRMARER